MSCRVNRQPSAEEMKSKHHSLSAHVTEIDGSWAGVVNLQICISILNSIQLSGTVTYAVVSAEANLDKGTFE